MEADPDVFYEPNVLIGRSDYISANSDVSVAIIKAMLKAKDDIVSDPEAFYELSAEKSGRTLEQVKSVAVSDLELGYPISLDDRYITSLKNIEEFELNNNIITNQVDFDSWIDSSYLEKAVQEYQESAQKGGRVSMYKGNNVFIQKLLIFINMIILPVLIVLAWHFATSTGAMSTLILPKISTVLETLKEQIANGTLPGDIGISLSRIAKGYALAVVVGILLGVLMGMNKFANRFFMLTFTAIRQIPMIAWVPILIIWFGIGEESKVAVIFLAAYFPVLVNTVSGIERTDPKLIEVGKMYHLNGWQQFTKIYLPSALPSIFVGLKLGLSVSWMAVVGAEMIAATSGIGFRINDARSLMQYPVVFAGIIAIAVVGVIMDLAISLIGKLCTPWEKGR